MSSGVLTIIAKNGETINGFTQDSSVAKINIHRKIKKQQIVLRSVRVEYDTSAHALADQVIYIDLPFLSSAHLVDGVQFMSRLPIQLDNAVTTISYPNLPIQVDDDIPESFTMKIFKRTGAAVTASECIYVGLQFSYTS